MVLEWITGFGQKGGRWENAGEGAFIIGRGIQEFLEAGNAKLLEDVVQVRFFRRSRREGDDLNPLGGIARALQGLGRRRVRLLAGRVVVIGQDYFLGSILKKLNPFIG